MNLVHALLFFLLTRSGNALRCYVTDPIATSGKVDLTKVAPIQQNCTQYFDDLNQLTPVPFSVEDFSEDEFQCYTLEISTRKAQVSYQGCGIRNDCDDLVEALRSKWSTSTSSDLDRISCKECATDLCNSGVTQSVVLKSITDRQSLILTVVLVLIFMVIIAAIFRAIPRKSSSGTVKYMQVKV